jgi:hypothetical protein
MRTKWVYLVCASRTGVLLYLSLAALICAPQQSGTPRESAVRPEIRGVVLEAGVRQPVSDAVVSYWKMPPAGAVIGFSDAGMLGRAMTDASGTFSFAPDEFGTYYVLVKKEGYVKDSTVGGGLSYAATVRVSSDNPIGEARLSLAQPAEITGLLFDGENAQPIRDVPVYAWEDNYARGRRMPMPVGRAVTDENGRFVTRVPPADYLVAVQPRIWGSERLLKKFSEDDLKAVDMDYGQTYWAGERDEDSAVPFSIGSGGVSELGVLKVRKTPFYRVHVSYPAVTCQPRDIALVTLSAVPPKWKSGLGEVPCGKTFLVRGLAPGEHRLDVVLAGPSFTREKRQRGSVTFQVVDKNQDIVVPLMRGIDIDGKVVPADGAARPPDNILRLYLGAAVGAPISDEGPVAPDAKGNFRLINVHPSEQTLAISEVASGWYVKEVRYNGRALRGNLSGLTLDPDTSAVSRSLGIEVDDKPALVFGAVTDRDRPVSQPYVVLVRWPLNNSTDLWPISGVTGDLDGKFQFTGVAPGDYRILAFSSALRKNEFEKPNILQQLLVNAEQITLGPRGSQRLTLKLNELR